MATGLLAVVTGTATRLSQFVAEHEKTYEAEIEFGKVSDTYDIEGKLVDTGMRCEPEQLEIEHALESFRGTFLQTPPPVSAKKIKGVPAYKMARKKLPVELQPVQVTVSRMVITRHWQGGVAISVMCSPGTYIRSIAHDLGQRLGCGAVLSRLRRTRIGPWTVEKSRTLECLTKMAAEGRLGEALIPSTDMLPDMPSEYVDETIEMQIRQGRDFRTSPFAVRVGAPFVKAVSRQGELIAIGALKMPNLYHPGTVL